MVALAFFVCAFLAPIIGMVSSSATCGALVVVGYLMMSDIGKIDWGSLEAAIPAFVTIMGILFTYSITNGIGFGFITYVVVKVTQGHWRDVKPLMWIVSAAFPVHVRRVLVGGGASGALQGARGARLELRVAKGRRRGGEGGGEDRAASSCLGRRLLADLVPGRRSSCESRVPSPHPAPLSRKPIMRCRLARYRQLVHTFAVKKQPRNHRLTRWLRGCLL